MAKAKVIAHDKRRASREEAFSPLDKLATVPQLAIKAEKDRAIIRAADDIKQIAIEAAIDEVSLKAAISPLALQAKL